MAGRREARGGRSCETKAASGSEPELGLVCSTSSEEIRFRALTRKRLLGHATPDQKILLRGLYADNIERLDAALSYCARHRIRLYRVPSSLFPFADEPVGRAVLEEFEAAMLAVGEKALALGIRLVLHPEPFVVLNSEAPQVIDNSLKVLATQAWIMDLLAQPRSSWAAIELHGGKGGRADHLVEIIPRLPETIRTRLVLENDEHAYGSLEVLDICRRAGVPMVFDAHHHVCREKLSSYDHPSIVDVLAAARSTWPDPGWQLVHISNGRDGMTDPHHSDLIELVPEAFRNAPWIEVEAKGKERAIAKMLSGWLALPRRKAERGSSLPGSRPVKPSAVVPRDRRGLTPVRRARTPPGPNGSTKM